MNKKETFREYLMEKCMNDTHALDDELPDVYEDWVDNQDVEDIIDWAEKWAKPAVTEKDIAEFIENRGVPSLTKAYKKLKQVEPDIELKKLKEEFEEKFVSSDPFNGYQWSESTMEIWNFFAPHIRESKKQAVEMVIAEKYRRVKKSYDRATKIEKKSRLGAKLTVLRQLKKEYPVYLSTLESSDNRGNK